MSEASKVLCKNSRSFSFAAACLPAILREDVTALYGWCRTVDDAVDHAKNADDAREVLRMLEEDLYAIERGDPYQHAASAWIEPLIASGKFETRYAAELIEGMQMDVDGFYVETEDDLRLYCYHAAGTVGLMMCGVMGVNDESARQKAIALGVAMQMTNIARDVREDAERGRSYLPGIGSPLSEDSSTVKQSVQRLLRLAEQEYQEGMSGIRMLPAQCRHAIRTAAVVYREIGREIERRSFPVLVRRVTVPKWRFLFVACKVALIPNVASFLPWVSKLNFVAQFQAWMSSTTAALSNFLSDGSGFTMSESKMNHVESAAAVAKARSAVCLGLSLTAFMAAALFMLVYVNPKDSVYGSMPLVYSAVSAVLGVVLNRMSVYFERSIELIELKN
ncbi:MAG: phytoene/squalene synthase family protein [Planctomycetota bacterium]